MIYVYQTAHMNKRMSLRSRLRIRTRLRSAVRYIRPPKPKPLILIYHRIAEPPPADPWGLSVSPAHFLEQLQVLRRIRQSFPLVEFVRSLIAGTLPSNAVALTLDDGYVDNLISCKPLLEATDTPATVFLATGYIGCPEPFWWDELATLILTEASSQRFEFVIHDELMRFDFRTASDGDGKLPNLDTPANRRHAAMWTIWEALRRLDHEERRSEMAKLRSAFAANDDRTSLGRAMTENEVRTIASDGLVTIGAHTVTHPVLSRLESSACYREITASKLACEALIGRSVAAFAYPYGDFNAEVHEAVRAADFSLACATRRVPASVTSDVFALPRIHIPNIGGDAFEKALQTASETN